eukprot:596216-Hanusia_phi.AAC.1
MIGSSANLTLWGEVNLDVPKARAQTKVRRRHHHRRAYAPRAARFSPWPSQPTVTGGLHEDLLRFLWYPARGSHRSTALPVRLSTATSTLTVGGRPSLRASVMRSRRSRRSSLELSRGCCRFGLILLSSSTSSEPTIGPKRVGLPRPQDRVGHRPPPTRGSC